jgi:hypothetical protein
MNEHCCNDTDRGKLKYSRAELISASLCPPKCHVDWPGIRHGPLSQEVMQDEIWVHHFKPKSK